MVASLGSAAIFSCREARGDGVPSSRPSSQEFISREEYERRIDQLLQEQERMRQELAALKKATTPSSRPIPQSEQPPGLPPQSQSAASQPHQPPDAPPAAVNPAVSNDLGELHEQVNELHLHRPGFDQFVILGDAAFGFSAPRHGISSFDAGVAPLILWRPADKFLVEAAADIGVSTDIDGNSSTSFDLTIANVSYELTDHLVIGAGLFVVPFGVYHNHFDPPWINKLPDDPLAFSDGGIAPGSEVGFFARGAMPAGSTKITYDAYITNGPSLITSDPGAAGSLNFDDFTDLNGNKAFGGRLGFLPMPNMELGYSIQFSEPNASGTNRAHATLQAFDFNYRPVIDQLYGTVDVRAEWVLSNVSRRTYDTDGALGFGPTNFGNYRQGGYLQLAYRPTQADSTFIRNLEFVSRYDWLTSPTNAPGGEHEQRLAFGVDYWVAPNAVLKFAYEFDKRKVEQNQNIFMIQFGLGL